MRPEAPETAGVGRIGGDVAVGETEPRVGETVDVVTTELEGVPPVPAIDVRE